MTPTEGGRYIAGTHGTQLPGAVNPFNIGEVDRLQDVRDAVVIVDPQTPNAFQLNLATLQADSIAAATQQVLRGDNTNLNTKTMASAVLRNIADNAMRQKQAQSLAPPSVGVGVPQSMASTSSIQQSMQTAQHQFTPVHVLPTAVEQQGSLFTQPPTRQQQAASTPVRTATVLFEIQHFGQLTAVYNEVIVLNDIIVLVYDSRASTQVKYFPQVASTPDQPMAMHVQGTDVLYLCRPTGIQFPHSDFEYCILSVTEVHPISQG